MHYLQNCQSQIVINRNLSIANRNNLSIANSELEILVSGMITSTIGSPETRVILVALARVNVSHWFNIMTNVYTRERHENKNTRFWATYASTKN